jgi:hypothetical protein
MVEEGMMGRGGGGCGCERARCGIDAGCGRRNKSCGGAPKKREMQVTPPCCSPCLRATHLHPNTTRIIGRELTTDRSRDGAGCGSEQPSSKEKRWGAAKAANENAKRKTQNHKL